MALPMLAAIMGGASLGSGALSYLGAQKAAGAQQQAAQQSGLFGLLSQQQALAQAREMAEKVRRRLANITIEAVKTFKRKADLAQRRRESSTAKALVFKNLTWAQARVL